MSRFRKIYSYTLLTSINQFIYVLYDIRYNYLCVIYGWDNECIMTEEWKIQMGIYNLKSKDKQPFYNVLVDDGSTRYAAQGHFFFLFFLIYLFGDFS